MKNLVEWQIERMIDESFNEVFNTSRLGKAVGSIGSTEHYQSIYYRLLFRPIDRLTKMAIADAAAKDETINQDVAKQNQIRQGVLRDIVAVATNIIANGGQSASHTSTNFNRANSSLSS